VILLLMNLTRSINSVLFFKSIKIYKKEFKKMTKVENLNDIVIKDKESESPGDDVYPLREEVVNETVAMFIDQENIFYASLHNAKSFPCYHSIMGYVYGHIGRVVKAEAVCDWTRLENSLRFVMNAGIEPVYVCDAATMNGGKVSRKPSFTVGKIYIDAIDFMLSNSNVSTYVIVSGNREFIPLVHYLRSRGKTVIIICEEFSLSYELRSAADHCVFLHDIGGLRAAPDREGNQSEFDNKVYKNMEDNNSN
jgi:hypothetical protein